VAPRARTILRLTQGDASILELMETYGYRLPPDAPGLAEIKVPNPAP
jgi:hypothetical protein